MNRRQRERSIRLRRFRRITIRERWERNIVRLTIIALKGGMPPRKKPYNTLHYYGESLSSKHLDFKAATVRAKPIEFKALENG